METKRGRESFSDRLVRLSATDAVGADPKTTPDPLDEAAEFAAPRPFALRVAGAFSRRAGWTWRRLTVGERSPAIPAAWDWLAGQGGAGGLPVACGDQAACPGVTGAAIAVAWAFGQDDLADRWSDWLLAIQMSDGAIPDSGLREPSVFNTGRALAGWLALAESRPATVPAATRACTWLLSRLDGDGRLRPPERRGGSFDHWASPAIHLAALAPLLSAARRWQQPEWEAAAWRAVRHCLRQSDVARWDEPSHLFAHRLAALVELGLVEPVRQALSLVDALQRPEGSLPATPGERWVSTSGLAHLASVWLRLGERERAGLALDWLARHQTVHGGFLGSYGRGAAYFPQRETAWTALHFLEASLLRASAAFDADGPPLPDVIATADGRAAAVRDWSLTCANGPAGARLRIADLGCGSGRYLRWLAEWLPQARLTGIDVSPALLARLPASVQARQGSLLRIPAADGEFDAVLAVESLEHALLPRRAIAELCRVVRPGGGVLIIDKNARKQALSQHQPWEQWFSRDQITGWLAEHCGDVQCRAIPHGVPPRHAGLFLAASGMRSASRSERLAA